jgi:hypothetical protein
MITQQWLLQIISTSMDAGFTLTKLKARCPETGESQLDIIIHASLLRILELFIAFSGTQRSNNLLMTQLMFEKLIRRSLRRSINVAFGPPYSKYHLKQRVLANYLSVVSNWVCIHVHPN